MSQQCCNAVLRKKSSLRIVSCTITLTLTERFSFTCFQCLKGFWKVFSLTLTEPSSKRKNRENKNNTRTERLRSKVFTLRSKQFGCKSLFRFIDAIPENVSASLISLSDIVTTSLESAGRIHGKENGSYENHSHDIRIALKHLKIG